MLADKDRVLIAVSGGVDSLFLAWLLIEWRRKAPISYDVSAIHLDMGFAQPTSPLVMEQLEKLQIPYAIEHTSFGREALMIEDGKSGCYHCARQRRNYLFDLARRHGYNKIGFGHHQEDIIETCFLNMLYSGNLSTMVPRQDLFGGRLAIIRPLAYLQKKEIITLADQLEIQPVSNPCPLADDSRRERIRKLLLDLYAENPAIKGNIFAALGNVKTQYLLRSISNDYTTDDEDLS